MFPLEDLNFEKRLDELQKLCQDRALTIATAESCTGGLIGALLSHQSGSSGHYLGSIVAYANAVKTKVLKVPSELIDKHGAVSQEVAESMAMQVRHLMGSDFSLAVTGIAGPSGGTPDKPVGTVWCAWANAEGVQSQKFHFPGDRETVRALTAWHSLDGLWSLLQVHLPTP